MKYDNGRRYMLEIIKEPVTVRLFTIRMPRINILKAAIVIVVSCLVNIDFRANDKFEALSKRETWESLEVS